MIYHTSDSIFLDSPLNKEGFGQALELGRYIDASGKNKDTTSGTDESLSKTKDVLTALRGDIGSDGKQLVSSVMVTSNLRRSIATVVCCSWNRLMKTGEKIHMFSGLQEISLNVDTKAMSDSQGIPDIRRIRQYVPEYKEDEPNLYLDPTAIHGNKTTAFNGLKRLKAFNEWAFNRDEDVVIASGHSLWFKYYFLTYLSHGSTHDAMCTKIVNGGAVACVVHRGTMVNADGTTTTCYKVEEDSIVPVYGGFEKKKK